MHRSCFAALAAVMLSPWSSPAQRLIPVGAKLPEPPPAVAEPSPLPFGSSTTPGDNGPTLIVPERAPEGTPVSNFTKTDELPETPSEPRFPLNETPKAEPTVETPVRHRG